MPYARIQSATSLGLKPIPIQIEVDLSNGLPAFIVVGLPDKAVEEAKERVRSAIKNSGFDFPQKRIVVNLAPADIPKEGPAYDLPIALGILSAAGLVAPNYHKALVLGELSLDGALRRTSGILPIILEAAKLDIKEIYFPAGNAKGIPIPDGLRAYPVENLKDLAYHLNHEKRLSPLPERIFSLRNEASYELGFENIKGQAQAKRALEIAAAGNHNVLLCGPPGTGKTLLAKALPSILPPVSLSEAIEITKIHSVAGLEDGDGLITKRPFRSPHHTASNIALVGGGKNPKPGEVSLSHRGVLFLDETPEFPRSSLEALRQPLENGKVVISRAERCVSYPATFIFVASLNPCPCGYLGDPKKECRCQPREIMRYQNRISGPLSDRIDLQLEIPRLDFETLSGKEMGEDSKTVQERVAEARRLQAERFEKMAIITNAEMGPKEIERFCLLGKEEKELLKEALEKLNFSARGYNKVLKVARTIADLEKAPEITVPHIAEALQYRPQK